MLEFSEDFFKGEERDGFYIESLMKKNWAVALDMLHEISVICEKHDIKWYADSGTLLGAVRNGHIISWDDDVDIVMPRAELYKFAEVAKQELPDYYTFMEGGIEAMSVGSVVTNSIIKTREAAYYEEAYHGFPYTVNIDIYPLDDVAQDMDVRNLQASVLNGLTACFALIENRLSPKEEYVKAYSQMLEVLGLPVDPAMAEKSPETIKKMIWDTYNQVSQIANNTGSDEWCYPHWVAKGATTFFKKKWYRDTVDIPFENIVVKAPVDYEDLLVVCYGPNWRVPVQAGSAHGYPCYNKDRRKLEQNQAMQLLTQVLAQTTGQSPDAETVYNQVSYDDDFNVYEAEVEGETFIMIIPTYDFTKSDKYVYDEKVWMSKKNKVCEQMKVVLYDGGPNSYVCGIKK